MIIVKWWLLTQVDARNIPGSVNLQCCYGCVAAAQHASVELYDQSENRERRKCNELCFLWWPAPRFSEL